MSTGKLTWCDKLALSGLVVFLVTMFLGWNMLFYDMERAGSARQYSHALDEPLQPAHTRELHDIRSGLTTWLTSYKKLDVPASYGAVYGKVEGFLGEADELAERFPTMTAPEFQGDLASLRSRIASVEQISRSVHNDKNPWLRGYVLFCLRTLGIVLLSCCAVIAIIVITCFASCQSVRSSASSDSGGNATSSSCGGGGDGSMGLHHGSGAVGIGPYGIPGPHYKDPFGLP